MILNSPICTPLLAKDWHATARLRARQRFLALQQCECAHTNYVSSIEQRFKSGDRNGGLFLTPAFDALNTFSAHRITMWGKRFPTAEHAFQWRKYSEVQPDLAEQILNAGCPEEAQRIAHQNKPAQPKDWHEKKVAVMEEILRAKLAQYEDVQEVLKRSGKRRIIENSPIDDFWGCWQNGDGKNMMGELWMKIRGEHPV